MIASVSDLIDALGGTQSFGSLLGVGASAVSNYRKTGLPAWTHMTIARECARRGVHPHPSLFQASKPGAGRSAVRIGGGQT